jgi:hypothetical protein
VQADAPGAASWPCSGATAGAAAAVAAAAACMAQQAACLTAEEGQGQARSHEQHAEPHAGEAQADELPATGGVSAGGQQSRVGRVGRLGG